MMIFFRNREFQANQLEMIADSNNSPLKWERFGRLKLEENQSFSERLGQEEAVLVLLKGKVRLQADATILGETGERKNLFIDPAWTFYLAPQTSYQIEAFRESIVLVVKVFAQKTGPSTLIPPEHIKIKTVGKGTYERIVHTIIDSDFPAGKVLVGETFNQPGLWSSYPPHRHEKNNPPDEYELEEVYHYCLRPQTGFGIQCWYNENHAIEEAFIVKNGDTFVISGGYHPVVAAPGYQLYYFWSLAGEKRILNPFDDPRHRWIKDE